MTGSSVRTGMDEDSHCSAEELCRGESSNSDRTMSEERSSSLKANAVWNLSGRRFKWGKQVKKRSKVVPTQQILCMVKDSSRGG